MNLNLFQCQDQIISSQNLFTGRGGIFFDRDGVIIEEKNYLSQTSQIKIPDEVISGIQKLKKLQKPFYVITNQAGIAHGFFDEKQLRLIQICLAEKMLTKKIKFRAVFYCPHHPEAEVPKYRSNCFSRKPNPGLLYQAARFDKLDLKHSYIIGDKLSDIEAGKKVGTKTILVLTGYGVEESKKIDPDQKPDFIAPNIDIAADWIIQLENRRSCK
jgi:D-glycero-D-manno-heptose 1,7-bisphosphate phosphatase